MIEKAKIRCTLDAALQLLFTHNRLSEHEVKDFKDNFDQSNLTIGIVGKMKAGKSSLVNAVVFNDVVLPSGSEPITVTLTEISYGENNSAEVELLTNSDIEELKELSAKTPKNDAETELVRNAKETLASLPDNYGQIISKGKIAIPLSDLADYVSTSGKLSGLAKMVKITIKNDGLKGITIIDTPGFNDPVISRGETTKKCLSKCNVLLFVHNHNGYDQVDASLLSEQIEYAGISELIDVYNKVDLLHIPTSEWDDQLEYFIDRRDEYLKKMESSPNVVAIMNDSKSILVSSLMALCGQIPPSEQSSFLKQNKSKYEEEFEELTELDGEETLESKLVELSNVNVVIDNINRIAKKSSSYLVEAPLLTLKGKLEAVINTVNQEILVEESKIETLNQNVQSAVQEKENVIAFFNEVKSEIEVNQLSSELKCLVSSCFNSLCSLRTSQSESEFTEQKYPNPGFGDRGVTKHNLSKYNAFVSSFENELRDCENDLLNNMRTQAKAYCGTLESRLVNTHIDLKQRKWFIDSLLKSMNEILDEINILITHHSLSELPQGNLMQYALLQNKFMEDFSDNSIQYSLKIFKEKADSLGDPNNILPILANLRATLIKIMSATPEQKEREKEVTIEKLDGLNKELEGYENIRKEISTLINSK